MTERLELLHAGAERLGICLEPGQLDQFETYYAELSDWNLRANLTSITDYTEVQAKHFLDSLTVCLAAEKELRTGAHVVDIGSGAGFPGIPLKIAFPGIDLHLIESVGKKTAFLSHLVGKLALDCTSVHTGRAEVLAREPELRESFDLALIRGVAKLPLLLEYSLPFCRTGGITVALKHGGLEAELEAAAHALSELGGEVAAVHRVELEGLMDNRVVVAIQKVAPTSERYPRRTGIPAKRPL
jgi:16S rRNA (guanine527-N7)-methyltransferase